MFSVSHSKNIGNYKLPIPQKLDLDGKNKADFFIPDVIGNKRFAQNYGGYPRSDIALINEQTNMAAAQSLLDCLQDYSQPDVNQGRSDTEILLGLQSKYCQAPSEQINYLQGEIARRDALRQTTGKPIDPKQQTIEFEKSDAPEDNAIG